jgi:membrane protease subunit (stomatin/prohibitin family)
MRPIQNSRNFDFDTYTKTTIMGLFDKLKNEFIDIIEWQDSSADTIVWRFPRYQNEIKMGAKLTVRESQVAVFLNEGKIADVFQPGMYSLETQNMPLMSTLRGWKYGFNSPFKADIYFVSTRQFIDQKWGTKNPITLSDERFGMIELRAFGSFAFRVTDAGKFLKEVSGTDGDYTTEDVTGQLKRRQFAN